MSKWKYLVGWCPECGKITVVPGGEAESRCGCGHSLLYKTACADAGDVSAAVREIEGKTEGAFESRPQHPSLDEMAEEAKEAARALAEEDGDDPFDAMGDLLCMMLGGDCSTCPLGGDGEEEAEEDELGRGDVREFMVVPSPYPIWARGETYEDALEALREHGGKFALAGFKAAMDDGDIEFTVIPVDGEGVPFKVAKRGDA